jgi:hypothetical protein
MVLASEYQWQLRSLATLASIFSGSLVVCATEELPWCRQVDGCGAVAKAATVLEAIPGIGVEFWIRRAQLLTTHCAHGQIGDVQGEAEPRGRHRGGCLCDWRALERIFERAVALHGSASVEIWLEWIAARRRRGAHGLSLLQRALSTLQDSLADTLVRAVRGEGHSLQHVD